MESRWFLSQYTYNNSHKISRDLLRGIFEQTEKCLEETIYTGRKISNRALSLFCTSLFLLTVTLGYLITRRLNNQTQDDFLVLTSLFNAVVFLFTSALSCVAIIPQPYFGTGSEPRHTLNRTIAESENQMAAFLLSECNDYQFRISQNKKINSKRSFYTNMALYLMVLVPCTLILAWILS